jgi:hypothetical protein
MEHAVKPGRIVSSAVVVSVAVLALGMAALSATTVQIGSTGRTYASSAFRCGDNAGVYSALVEAGLLNPKKRDSAAIFLNGTLVGNVTGDSPALNVSLGDGNNTVVVAINKKVADTYPFYVPPGSCALPDTSANTFSADGTLEYAASGKSYATVTPGCALNPATGLAEPYVHLVDDGGYLLNVSVNGEPLTQLSATRPHTPVFLGAGVNVISAANGSLTVDYYIRQGGTGTCSLQ